jgi:myo-inositol-1(or 4)-monophosphatase
VLASVCDLIDDHLREIIALRYVVSWKADGSPVTEADRMIEPLVHEHLSDLLGDVGLVGEESYHPDAPEHHGWRVVLDPIDGTENFCSGLKIWGVSVSLWFDHAHVGSLLYAPELGERLMTGDRFEPVGSRITGLSSAVSPVLVGELENAVEARILGCAVYNLINVIRGSFRRFVNPVGAYSWDLLAGVQLALEHGLKVRLDDQPYDGHYLSPGRRYRVDIRH